jgi:DNA-binding transcriptional LysR family regulator
MSGLQQFLAFAQTARCGSFAAAARDLGQAPSTLAKSVARLEAQLGVKLFHRTTRQVSLTPDGERLYRRCERVLAEVEDLQAEAAGSRALPSGTIRIDAPIAYGRRILVPLLAQLLQQHPPLQLDLRLQDAYADLVRDGLDLAIRIGALQDSRLVAKRFDWQQLIVVASPDYLRSRGAPQRIEDLSGHAAIVFRMPSSGRLRPWQLREARRVVELHPAQRVQVNDGDGMVAAAREGLGLMQIPDYMVEDELAAGTLVELMADRRPPPMPISAVLPSARLVPPRVRLLLDALQGLRARRGG